MFSTFSTFLVFAFRFLQFRPRGAPALPGGSAALRRVPGPPRGGQDPRQGAANWQDAPGEGALPLGCLGRLSMFFFSPDQNTTGRKKNMLVDRRGGGPQACFFFASHVFFFWRGRGARPRPGPGGLAGSLAGGASGPVAPEGRESHRSIW